MGGHTAPKNLQLRIENVGTTRVDGARLTVNGRDWSSLDRMLAGIITLQMTDEQKARAIWQFARSSSYHWVPVSEDSADAVRYFNLYGYGLCTETARAMRALYRRAGFPTRMWHLDVPSRHEVVEVFYDGGWHLLDADQDALYLRRDNRTIAGVEDLIADPWLVERAGFSPANLAAIYAGTPLGIGFDTNFVEEESELTLSLRSGDALVFEWGQGSRHVTIDPLWAADPPNYANGHLLSRHAVPATGDPFAGFVRATDTTTVSQPLGSMWSPVAGRTGELIWRVDSAYPIVGSTLAARISRASSADAVRIYAAPFGTALSFGPSDLALGRFRVPNVLVAESNLITAAEGGGSPSVHTRGGGPASLTFRVTPSPEPGARVRVGGSFYRFSDTDDLSIAISLDGVTWQPVWAASPGDLHFFTRDVDVTALVGAASAFFVRYDLDAQSFGGLAPGSVGLERILIDGVLPPIDVLVWDSATDGRLGEVTLNVDLGPTVAPSPASPRFSYLVRVVLESSVTGSAGLRELSTDTLFQVSPYALPALDVGPNLVTYEDASGGATALRVTHAWTDGVGWPPASPARATTPVDGGVLPLTSPSVLAWQAAVDPDRDRIVAYHAQICADQTCGSPLSSTFDLHVTAAPGGSAAPRVTLPDLSWFSRGDTYYWRVRAQDETGAWSAFTSPWRFVAATAVPGAPTVQVDGAGAAPLTSTSFFTHLSGTAAGSSPVASVDWWTDAGRTGKAVGTSAWEIAALPLHAGVNQVTVAVTDSRGVQTRTSVQVLVNSLEYYLAEGATGDFFDTDVTIANPNPTAASVVAAFTSDGGAATTRSFSLAPYTSTTIRIDDLPDLSHTAVATRVTSTSGIPLAVERSMYWDRQRYGAHAARATAERSTKWYFAEGAQGFFDTFVLLSNADATPAQVRVRFLREWEPPIEHRVTVGPASRATVFAGDFADLQNRPFSIVVESDIAIVAERAMYFGATRRWEGGHASVGAPVPLTTWFHAEGATGAYFDTYLLLGNPDAQSADVTVDFLTADGKVVRKRYVVPPNRRLTVNVEDQDAALADAAVSTRITSSVPIVAERAMYWPGSGGTWLDAHSAVGSTQTAISWALADVGTGGADGRETYVLLANPDAKATAQLSLLFFTESGALAGGSVTVPPSTRVNVYVNGIAPGLAGQRVSLRIDSQNGVPVIAERASYWDALGIRWAAGVSAAGTPLP